MIKKIFLEQRELINHYFDHLDSLQVESFVQECLQCKGLLVFTGVGKSGIIAEKIAATLISTGTRALYLPPTNFLHGDLGILSQDDLLILISKSGETEELLHLIPFVQKRGTRILSIVSNKMSRLAKECAVSVTLPVLRELCPFDLAPTTSAAVQLLFGDLLAVALMRAKNFSIDSYALNHPAGTIGKKMTLTVDEIMLKGAHMPLCRPQDKVADLLATLSEKACGCLFVIDEQEHLVGVFTDGDLRRSLQRKGAAILEETMERLMTPMPLSVPTGLLAVQAMQVMQKDPKRWIQVLPVVDGARAVGAIRMHDIVRAGLSEMQEG